MWVGYANAVDAFVTAEPALEPEVIAGAVETFEKMVAWIRA
jgi:hypothetical protein